MVCVVCIRGREEELGFNGESGRKWTLNRRQPKCAVTFHHYLKIGLDRMEEAGAERSLFYVEWWYIIHSRRKCVCVGIMLNGEP